MPPRRVIGIDAGGTKLLGGVVDEELVVHHRVHRTWRGADRQETLDIMVEAVEEVRAVAPEAEAVGFGIPALAGLPGPAPAEPVAQPAQVAGRPQAAERLAARAVDLVLGAVGRGMHMYTVQQCRPDA